MAERALWGTVSKISDSRQPRQRLANKEQLIDAFTQLEIARAVAEADSVVFRLVPVVYDDDDDD